MIGQAHYGGDAPKDQEHQNRRQDTQAPENNMQNPQDFHVLRHAPSWLS